MYVSSSHHDVCDDWSTGSTTDASTETLSNHSPDNRNNRSENINGQGLSYDQDQENSSEDQEQGLGQDLNLVHLTRRQRAERRAYLRSNHLIKGLKGGGMSFFPATDSSVIEGYGHD